ncbi:hypothetical protein HYQ45_016729 [Verticillium longisporum]|uniref:Haloacid dehalogenase, type II n=1 Tax=Verticillium longisporum TaxID=100787 RepID=A0A8I2Z3X6_VERLO|nr:hypothetical protein HYQ44_018865 [Verticillium longisporum]KAG7113549.1 hypothetical protein HYQ45_016729 [Verticillium longisporum]
MPSHPDLTSFKALSFDNYGTLVDYESSLRHHLAPLHAALPPSHDLKDMVTLMRRFNAASDTLEHDEPALLADELLARTFRKLAADLDVTDQLTEADFAAWRDMAGASVPFGDTVAGLQKLERRYKLFILSNVDERNIAASVGAMRPVEFDGVYTAERIGSYKPAHANFRYLFERVEREHGVGFDKGELLHVARSLRADHVPAKELGLRSVWIARGGDTKEGQGIGGDPEGLKDDVAFGWKFQTIGEFADEVERQFAAKGE